MDVCSWSVGISVNWRWLHWGESVTSTNEAEKENRGSKVKEAKF